MFVNFNYFPSVFLNTSSLSCCRGAINSARSFVTSWLTELIQPHPEELAETNKEEEIEEEKKDTSTQDDIQSAKKS